MAHPYSPSPTFPSSYVLPDDGDPKTASSVGIGLEAVGDRTQFLYRKGGQQYADLAALRAVLAPVHGDRALLPDGGEFIFSTFATWADDPMLHVAPTDATPGTWVNSAFVGMTSGPTGVPRMVGYKVLPENISNAVIFEDAKGPIHATGVAGTAFDIPGTTMTFAVTAGDVLFVEAHALLGTPSGGTAIPNIIVSINGGTSIGMGMLNPGSQNSLKFKRVVAADGTAVVKLNHAVDAGTTGGINVDFACVSVKQVRP